tara:strand:+ start:1212 stop:1736 length:525 start_codon:yes stop_codon:yes gene_type:complete
MNAFILDTNPIKAAQMHCDEHMKQAVEAAQMAATALMRHTMLTDTMPFRVDGKTRYSGKAHPHHPCTRWAGDSRANYEWMVKYGIAVCYQHTLRYGTQHGCLDALIHLSKYSHHIPDGELTPFAQAMPQELKGDDPVKAYRAYYNTKMFKNDKRPSWTHGVPAPVWWQDMEVKV